MSVVITDRSDAAALIPVTQANEIVQGVVEKSVVMQLGTRLQNMSSKAHRMPVHNQLPQAHFVDGDTGLKQTSKQAWENKFIHAEEIAVIMPIPEAVLDDSEYDMWGQIRPRVEEAFAKTFDAAVLVGESAPATWPDDIFTGANGAGHVLTRSEEGVEGRGV